MSAIAFPKKLQELEAFSERFDAYRLQTDKVDVYFASYPAGTNIAEHSHDTENYGIITQGALWLTVDGNEQKYEIGQWYHIPANAPHSARFEQDTAEIELWFKQ